MIKQEEPCEARVSNTVPWEREGEIPLRDPIMRHALATVLNYSIKSMNFRKIFLTTTFLIACFVTKAQVIVPFILSPQGHIIFNAQINGVNGKFIFDTGAGINLVTKKYFDKLSGLTTDGNFFTGFRATGDRLDVQLYQAKELRIGKFIYSIPFVTFLDVDDWGDVDGIISLKNFEHSIITIDYKDSTLIIDDSQHLSILKKFSKAVFPIQIDNGRNIALGILCYVKINDTLKAQFVMDSGAGKNVFRINARYLANLNIDKSDTTKVKTTIFKSELKKDFENIIYRTPVDKISIFANDAIAIKNVKGQFV